MGLIYDAGESSAVKSALAANLRGATAVLDRTHAATDRLQAALGRGDLSGAGYSAVGALFETVISPTVANAKSDLALVQGDLDKYAAADSKISRYGVLKEDELNKQLAATKAQRDATERQIEAHSEAAAAAGIPGLAESLEAVNRRLELVLNQLDADIRDIEDKLTALHGFAGATKGLFMGRLETLAAVTGDTVALLKQLNQPFRGVPAPVLDTAGKTLGAAATRNQILDFLAGKKITEDAKGRLMWQGRYLYDPKRDQLSQRGKAFNKATKSQIDDYGKPIKAGAKAALKAPIEDFTGWKGASKLAKVGKGFGAAGIALTITANADTYFADGVQGNDVPDFAVDTGVDLAAGAAGAGIGAFAGSFIVPPAGTIIGAGVGFAVGLLLNFPWGGGPSATDLAKDAIKKTYR